MKSLRIRFSTSAISDNNSNTRSYTCIRSHVRLHGLNEVECVIIGRMSFKVTVLSNSPSNEKIIAQISQEEI